MLGKKHVEAENILKHIFIITERMLTDPCDKVSKSPKISVNLRIFLLLFFYKARLIQVVKYHAQILKNIM